MREMKDSGIEWVGKIPHCWNTSKLKYLGQYINGYAFKPEEWGSKGVPIIRIQDLTGSNDNPNYFEGQIDKKYWVENGDILISWAATLDAFIWNKGKGWLNQHIFKAVPNRRIINYDFFFWMIKESMKNMNNDNKHGIFMQHVTLSVFNNFTIPMPPLAEQERIAAFLDAECAEIDTVLEKTRASIEEYKKLKQAVITRTVTKGIFDKQIYPHNVKLKYLLYIASGDAIRNEELSEVGKYPAYGGGESLGFASKYNTLENSLIVGRVGARCGCVTYIDSKAWATDNALIVHPICNPRYMYYMLIYSQLNNLNTSNAQPLITATKIKNVVVPYFLEDICQRKIVDFLDEKCACIDAIIEKKQQYITEIENYKKSLIYEYVTGKKEVV